MRLRVLRGGHEGGAGGACSNHPDQQANYRVACTGPGVVRMWLLCTPCANTMLANIDGAIAAPVWRKHRGKSR